MRTGPTPVDPAVCGFLRRIRGTSRKAAMPRDRLVGPPAAAMKQLGKTSVRAQTDVGVGLPLLPGSLRNSTPTRRRARRAHRFHGDREASRDGGRSRDAGDQRSARSSRNYRDRHRRPRMLFGNGVELMGADPHKLHIFFGTLEIQIISFPDSYFGNAVRHSGARDLQCAASPQNSSRNPPAGLG